MLTGFDSEQAILTHPEVFIHVADRIRSGDMPPKEEQPLNLGDQKILLQWIELMLETEAASRAGDPGPVALRRLSNTEYDNACLLYTSPSPRDRTRSRMPSSA